MASDALGQVEYLGPPSSPDLALASLVAPVRAWFHQRFNQPTPAQRLSWPALTTRQGFLFFAPTGSGKTLAAFLPVIGELLTAPNFGAVRCLYVSPLKALTNDARKTLRLAIRQ